MTRRDHARTHLRPWWLCSTCRAQRRRATVLPTSAVHYAERHAERDVRPADDAPTAPLAASAAAARSATRRNRAGRPTVGGRDGASSARTGSGLAFAAADQAPVFFTSGGGYDTGGYDVGGCNTSGVVDPGAGCSPADGGCCI